MLFKQNSELTNLKSLAKALSEELSNLRSTIESLKQSIVKQQKQIAELQSKLSVEVEPSSPSISTDDPYIHSKPTQVPSADIPTMVTSLIAEEKVKDKWRLNLIVHQLIESTKTDAQKRKEYDIQEISRVIQNYLGVSASITNTVRLESRGAKPQLLKISVKKKLQF